MTVSVAISQHTHTHTISYSIKLNEDTKFSLVFRKIFPPIIPGGTMNLVHASLSTPHLRWCILSLLMHVTRIKWHDDMAKRAHHTKCFQTGQHISYLTLTAMQLGRIIFMQIDYDSNRWIHALCSKHIAYGDLKCTIATNIKNEIIVCNALKNALQRRKTEFSNSISMTMTTTDNENNTIMNLAPSKRQRFGLITNTIF